MCKRISVQELELLSHPIAANISKISGDNSNTTIFLTRRLPMVTNLTFFECTLSLYKTTNVSSKLHNFWTRNQVIFRLSFKKNILIVEYFLPNDFIDIKSSWKLFHIQIFIEIWWYEHISKNQNWNDFNFFKEYECNSSHKMMHFIHLQLH